MKKKETASSASSWATFKEDIPKKINVGDVWKNEMKLPPEKGRQLESATDPGATLMGRLASRMTARNMIDQTILGPKAKSTHAKRAQIADDSEYASGTHPKIHEPLAGSHKAPQAPTIGDSIPSKMMMGPGLHEHTRDLVASNFANPILEGKKAPGSNMYDQAVNSGNIFEDKEFGRKMKEIRKK